MVTKKDKYLAAAQKFLEKGNLDKALAEFQGAVREDPKDTRTWLRIAEIFVKRGENEKATEVYLKTADLYVEQGFFQRAVAVYKNIIKLGPGFAEAYLKLAEIYRQLGLLSDAVQQYEQAAAVFLRAGRSKDAMNALRQIVEVNPDQPVSRIKLAEAASQLGMVGEAVAEFARAADLLKAQGRSEEYLRVAERLLYHQPDNVPLAKQVAREYIAQNNARVALAKLQSCFKHDPRDTETLDLLARAFESLGQGAKSVSVLKELAKVYADTGRTSDRTQAVQRMLALDPHDAEAREMLGIRPSPAPAAPLRASPLMEPPRPVRGVAPITFSELEVPQALRDMSQEPVAPLPSAPAATPAASTAERVAIASGLLEQTEEEAALEVQRIVAEADVFVKYGLVDRAIEHLRRVFEHLPTHIGAHERLAAVYLQLGRNGEAVAELEVLAEQLAASQPDAAVNYARRALGVDPMARRAQRVLHALQPGQPGDDDVLEISSSGIEVLEMDTPQPEAHSEELQVDFTEEGTVISPTIIEETIPHRPFIDAGEITENLRRFDPRSPAAVRPAPARPEPEAPAALDGDLEQVDFFLDQGLVEEARELLDDVVSRFRSSPAVEERRRRLDRMERPPSQGAVPMANHGGGASSPYVPTITPRAVVASGGEIDLETHRDVGIGYKEMGLFDAAIGEFTVLANDPVHEVFALTMIGECHEAKGGLADAVAVYKKALNRSGITDTEANQLYFQLGGVFQAMGEANEALYFFEKVAKRDSEFRDVRRRLTELRGQAAGRGEALGVRRR